jgi:hypothetical protein
MHEDQSAPPRWSLPYPDARIWVIRYNNRCEWNNQDIYCVATLIALLVLPRRIPKNWGPLQFVLKGAPQPNQCESPSICPDAYGRHLSIPALETLPRIEEQSV